MVLQLHLHQLGLVVAAIEDGKVVVRAVGFQVLGEDFHRHPLALGVFVAATNHPDRIAVTHLAPELFLEGVRVIADQGVGAFEDAAGGAIVLLEHHHLQRRVVVFQQHQVFWPRAAPGVDRLVIVADHGELIARADQQFHQ